MERIEDFFITAALGLCIMVLLGTASIAITSVLLYTPEWIIPSIFALCGFYLVGTFFKE